MNTPGPMLQILTGDLSGRRYRVEDSEFVIGRAPNCDLVLPKRYISREHARISRNGREYVIDGLSETNPVLVRDRPVRPRHRLADGDEFEMCGIRFRFVASGDAGAPKAPNAVMSSGDDRQEEEQDSSWRSDPGFKGGAARGDESDAQPVKKRDRFADDEDDTQDTGGRPATTRPRGRVDEPSDLSDVSGPRGLPREDDTDDARGAPPPRGAGPANKRSGAGAGKVVFDDPVDADEDEDEKTKELPTVKTSARPGAKGAARAASAGSGESQNERTAELGKVKDPNDPDYDPFAEVDQKKKKEKKDPGRDKALKLLMMVGALGIVLAGGILWKLNEVKPIEYVDAPTPIRVALNQTVRFEEPWSKVDPPSGRTATRRDGEPYIYARDAVVEVEWAVPHMQTKCVFLVRGVELGETQFSVSFPESRRVKRFTVIVEGDNPHEVAQERRRAELRAKSPHQLRQIAEGHLGSGDTYTKEREVPSREGNFRLAFVEYSRAADAALVLRDLLAKEGTVPSDVTELVRRAEESKSKAETDWEDFINKALAVYRSNLQRESRNECVEQLQRVLRVINHDCDTRFQRLRLILEESWVGEWNGDGTEACTER